MRRKNGWSMIPGDIVAEQDYFEHDRRWAIRLLNGGHVQQMVSGIAAVDAPHILGLSAQGDDLIVSQTEADRIRWKPLLIKDGTWGPEMTANGPLTELVLKGGQPKNDRYRIRWDDAPDITSWIPACRTVGTGSYGFSRISVSSSCRCRPIIQRYSSKYSDRNQATRYFLADVKEHVTNRSARSTVA